MRISDWSSDVCSSDLGGAALVADRIAIPHRTANALEFRCALQLKPLARIAVVTAALKPLDRCPADDGFKGRALDLDSVKVLRSEEHTSELQSLMRISYAVFCLKKKNKITNDNT